MSEIVRAATILRQGGLVAFPTETVYGLGADAANRSAVLRIFAAKGRPETNPIIVHVADENVARRYARIWPETAQALAGKFWPGPLTLVVPRQASIVDEVTAGLDTVGLRCPDHPLALALLREFDGPVAAPSANRSTRVSPTSAEHVREELGPAVDLVLDGGPCRVGIESTVLDLTSATPSILRPGDITADQIRSLIGPVRISSGVADPSRAATSPGQQSVHYAPRARAYRFPSGGSEEVAVWRAGHPHETAAVLVIGPGDGALAQGGDVRVVSMPTAPSEYARRLYSVLRELDNARVGVIWIEMPPDEPAWAAVRDRLLRATRRNG